MRSFRVLAVILCSALAVACAGGDPTDATPTSSASEPSGTSPRERAATPPAESAAKSTPTPQKQFPALDYLQQIPQAYRVANENPELLAQIPCYCPCMLYGHGAVIDCHRSQHSAACATCLDEAVTAGRLLIASGAEPAPDVYAQIAAQIKNRYRQGVVQNMMQNGQMPNLQSEGGRAFLTVCSDCHQPAHPAMYTADGWRQSLARMEAHAGQRGTEIDAVQWAAAVNYVRSTSGQFPAAAGEKYRQDLAQAVEHLKAAEGDAVYYPSPRDKVLDPEWFERMVEAYRLARDIPAEVLAATEIDDPSCSNLLECLNTTAAVTSEAAVEAVYRIAAERGND